MMRAQLTVKHTLLMHMLLKQQLAYRIFMRQHCQAGKLMLTLILLASLLSVWDISVWQQRVRCGGESVAQRRLGGVCD